MKAKIILYVEGDKEVIKNIYLEITRGDSMKATYGEWKNHDFIETQAKVYKTELKEE